MQEHKIEIGGKELAKVLYYYGLVQDATSYKQKIICPFHNDIGPSMAIDYDKGTFSCFGCGESGNALQFVKNISKKNDLQSALEYVKILKSDKVKKINLSGRTKKRETNQQLLDEAHDYYFGLNKIDWCQKELEEEIKTVKEYMIDRGFKPKTLNECQAKFSYSYNYPLICPMFDNGEFKGWVSRTNKLEVAKKRKYLYNEGLSKKNTLVGNYGNRPYVIIVEGYLDRLKFIQNLKACGRNEDVVAILGWKISNEQIQKLKEKNITHVISALDNDDCGKKGTEYLMTKFKVTRFCYLKNIKDPGDMGINQFKKMFDKTLKQFVQDRQV